MVSDQRVTRNGRPVPVVAFFGTKGGVGKTTIARRFAEHVTLAEAAPNVLVVDVDVHNRGMTVEMTAHRPHTCKTVHDYIASKNVADVEAVDMTHQVRHGRPDSGKLHFIPASTPEADHVFDKSAEIGAENLLEILHAVIASAVEQYRCDCVVIDCGPIIDPYTAVGAVLADRAFIIGQNEPISFSNLRIYPGRIREFYEQFSTTKLKLIINKVRGWESLKERGQHDEVFAAIPFTMDIVDISEGLAASNDMQIMIFEDHIAQIVEKVFAGDHPELIPPREQLLPEKWKSLVDNAARVAQSPRIRRLGVLRMLLPVGLLAVVLGGFMFYAGSTGRRQRQNEIRANLIASAIKAKIPKQRTTTSPDVSPLKRALAAVEAADPTDDSGLEEAIKLARAAGVDDIPSVQKLSTSVENTGIAVLVGGVFVAGLGLHFGRTRKSYLSVLSGIRHKGIKWMMSEMNAKRSSRKTLDKLLKMSDNLGS